MIVNSLGQLVILGTTSSTNYPTSVGTYDDSFNGGTAVNYTANGTDFQNGSDIVISILSTDGSSLIGSTFMGGSLNDGLNENTTLSYNYGDIFRGEVVVDDADNIYITSSTVSADFLQLSEQSVNLWEERRMRFAQSSTATFPLCFGVRFWEEMVLMQVIP